MTYMGNQWVDIPEGETDTVTSDYYKEVEVLHLGYEYAEPAQQVAIDKILAIARSSGLLMTSSFLELSTDGEYIGDSCVNHDKDGLRDDFASKILEAMETFD